MGELYSPFFLFSIFFLSRGRVLRRRGNGRGVLGALLLRPPPGWADPHGLQERGHGGEYTVPLYPFRLIVKTLPNSIGSADRLPSFPPLLREFFGNFCRLQFFFFVKNSRACFLYRRFNPSIHLLPSKFHLIVGSTLHFNPFLYITCNNYHINETLTRSFNNGRTKKARYTCPIHDKRKCRKIVRIRLLIDSKANYQNEGRRVPVVLAVVVVAGRNRKVVHWGRQTNGGQAVSKLVSRYRLSTRSACRFIAFTRRVKEGGAVLRRCVWSHARNGKGVASL